MTADDVLELAARIARPDLFAEADDLAERQLVATVDLA